MKRSSVFLVFPLVLAACSNPLLKWIKAPESIQATDASFAKAITSFSFGIKNETDEIRVISPRVDGKIPITVVLPPGTDPAQLPAPKITFIGSSISPPQGELLDFTSPQTYTVYAENGTSQKYEVEVLIKDSPPPAIKWFDLELSSGGDVMSEGVVTEGSAGQPGSIDIRVPSGIDLTVPLKAKIVQTGTLSGAGVTRPGDTAQIVTAVFSPGAPETYTVMAEDGTTKEYKVTVSRILSDDKEIKSFFVAGGSGIIGAEPQPDGKYPIMLTVPAGTGITGLAPEITYTGISITGPGISDSGGPGTVSSSPVDFSSPALKPFTYTVTAENGSTRDYVVTVGFDSDPGDDDAKAITGFYFTKPLAIGEIDEVNKIITVTVPSGTNRGALAPAVFFTGKTLSPLSGTTNDFNSPATYTVTAANGSYKAYQVRVVAGLSNAKEITDFSFPGVGVREMVIGAVPNPSGNIPISITVAEYTNTAELHPVITHTGKTISPASGAAGDFRTPVQYTVSAEDGSVKKYSVTVHTAGDGSKIITGFVFRPEDNSGNGLTVTAVGEIIHEDGPYNTIRVDVRSAVNLAGLRPLISYLGKSITHDDDITPDPAPDSVSEEKPFKDVPRDFSAYRVYKVTDEYGEPRYYAVQVTKVPDITVTFQPVTDLDFLQSSYDAGTGLLTITIKQSGSYGPPYLWRLDADVYPVSGPDETRLVLKIGDLQPGQHQLSVSVRKTDGRDYDNELYFYVQE